MHAQIKTLLLMAAVMAAIIVYAVIPTEITMGSYTIRKDNACQPKPTAY